jgi:hypothetical protein
MCSFLLLHGAICEAVTSKGDLNSNLTNYNCSKPGLSQAEQEGGEAEALGLSDFGWEPEVVYR